MSGDPAPGLLATREKMEGGRSGVGQVRQNARLEAGFSVDERPSFSPNLIRPLMLRSIRAFGPNNRAGGSGASDCQAHCNEPSQCRLESIRCFSSAKALIDAISWSASRTVRRRSLVKLILLCSVGIFMVGRSGQIRIRQECAFDKYSVDNSRPGRKPWKTFLGRAKSTRHQIRQEAGAGLQIATATSRRRLPACLHGRAVDGYFDPGYYDREN